MVNLNAQGPVARYFIWCCDHLPATVKRDYSENKAVRVRRKGTHYISAGTTLCHVFWATLWVPLFIAALTGFMFTGLVAIHVGTYKDFGPRLGVWAFFFPEGVALVLMLAVGIIVLAIFGADKSGFARVLWHYLKNIKTRVCPIVQFDGSP